MVADKLNAVEAMLQTIINGSHAGEAYPDVAKGVILTALFSRLHALVILAPAPLVARVARSPVQGIFAKALSRQDRLRLLAKLPMHGWKFCG
jgi:hypothetical protein